MSYKDFLGKSGSFFYRKHVFMFFCLLLLGALAVADYIHTGNKRYTMVFYTVDGGIPIIEERMIAAAETKEEAITRYIDEVLLGPVDLDTAPLFLEGTRLESLFCRNNDVYVNLSESAVLAPPNGIQDVKKNLSTLVSGIKRNFAFIERVILFVNGNEVIL